MWKTQASTSLPALSKAALENDSKTDHTSDSADSGSHIAGKSLS